MFSKVEYTYLVQIDDAMRYVVLCFDCIETSNIFYSIYDAFLRKKDKFLINTLERKTEREVLHLFFSSIWKRNILKLKPITIEDIRRETFDLSTDCVQAMYVDDYFAQGDEFII